MSFHRLQHLLLGLRETEAARRVREIADVIEDERLRVVVFGDFNRGKSTLINALLGRPLLQAKLIPTTGHVTRVVHGRPEQLALHFRDRPMEQVGLARLNEVATLDANGQVREDIEALTVAVDAPFLSSGLALIDTPGRNEASRQSDRAAAALLSADVVLWLLDARQCLHQHEREMTLAWLKDRPGVLLLPVVNFMNLLEEEDRRDVRARLDRWGEDGLHELTALPRSAVGKCYFEVNARGALLHATTQAPRPADDFSRLAEVLRQLAGPSRDLVRRRSRAAQARAVLEPLREDNDQRLLALDAALDVPRKKRESRRRDVRSELRSLEARGKTQKDVLTSAAASVLAGKLDSVKRWYDNETKARLEEHAANWYEHHLREGVTEVERLANAALAELAVSSGLSRPANVSLSHLSLGVVLGVGTLPPLEATGGEIGGWAVAGGILGFFLGGPAGAAIGAGLGGGIGAQSTDRTDADYVAAYQARAAEKWPTSTSFVLAELGKQFDAGLRKLTAQFQGRLSAIDAEADDPDLVRESAVRREVAGVITQLLTQWRQ
jgi:GTPase SAR1 family protein